MELILITCSGKKTEGGTSEYVPSQMAEYLSKPALERLLALRLELARMKQQPAGPDLGGTSPQKSSNICQLTCAMLGIFTNAATFAELFPRARDKKVLIVSALYGILDAHDSIQMYDAVMTESLPGGM